MQRSRLGNRLLAVLVATLLLLAGVGFPAAAEHLMVPTSCAPRGTITIDGVRAPAGTRVAAYIDGVERQWVLSSSGGSTDYLLTINGDDPDLNKQIRFKVGALWAPQTCLFTALGKPTVNLTISTVVPPTPTRTRTPTATATPRPGLLCVTAFLDANANQLRDPGEPGIPNAEINVFSYFTETLVATGQTDGQGGYCVNLVAGEYMVDEVDPPGFSSTTRHSRAAHMLVGTRKDIAFGDIGAGADTPTPGPTRTPTSSRTSTVTATYTSTPTVIPSATPTATNTAPPGSTPTRTATRPAVGPIDLLVGPVDLWTAPISVRQGDLVSLGANVHNASGAAIPAVEVEFWLGAVGTGTRLGDGPFVIPGISPYGMSAIASGPLWDTAGLEGQQTIHVVVDPRQLYQDTNRANNSASRPVDLFKAQDHQPPSGVLTINEGDAATAENRVTLGLSAADEPGGSGVQWMYLAEFGLNADTHQWEVTHDLGWIAYQTAQSWTLRGGGGVKYIAAWFADNAGNVSALPALAMINYAPAEQAIAAGEWHVYRWALPTGASVTLNLRTLSGDADLYLWQPGNLGAPDWLSAADGAAEAAGADDAITFTAAVAGVYQAQVYGQIDSTYSLTAAPGAPSAEQKAARRALLAKSAPEHPFSSSVPPAGLWTPTLRGFVSYIQLLLKMNMTR